MSPTRRHLLGAAALTAPAAFLAACSSGSSDSGASTSASRSSAAQRTVSTSHGSVRVPSAPARIVSVHSWTTESLYDLGITPIGVEDSGAEYVPSRYLKKWQPITKVVQGGKVQIERIAALKPDLVVGVAVPYLDQVYSKLRAVTPTAFAPFDTDLGWQAYPRYTADFVDRRAGLKTLQTRYTQRVAAVRSAHADALKSTKFDIIQGGFDEGNYWIYGTKCPIGSILTDLGAQFGSATSSAPATGNKSVSYERTAPLQDADAIIYYANNDGSAANKLANLQKLASYKTLPAVRAGHTLGTSDFLAGSYADALGALASIEKLLAKL